MPRIKNWDKFQHFKDRKPPWIKLYRDILDDLNWHKLEPAASKLLVMLWLIASENDGHVPDSATLAFRLRMSEKDVISGLSKLSHWLDQSDIKVISERYQYESVAEVSEHLEEERETEVEVEKETRIRAMPDLFEEFWQAYPRKVGKDAARKAFAKRKADRQLLDSMLAALVAQRCSKQWREEDGQFIPHPATWLNAGRWEDEETEVSGAQQDPESRSSIEARAMLKGLPRWNETEQWSIYKARVMSA